MPRPKLKVLEMTVPEAQEKVAELKKELFHLRFRNAMRQLDNPLQIHFLRKDVARLMTALAEHRQGIRSLATGEDVPAGAGAKTPAAKTPAVKKAATKAKPAKAAQAKAAGKGAKAPRAKGKKKE
jgi:large subunit ribosomal protein L29